MILALLTYLGFMTVFYLGTEEVTPTAACLNSLNAGMLAGVALTVQDTGPYLALAPAIQLAVALGVEVWRTGGDKTLAVAAYLLIAASLLTYGGMLMELGVSQ